MSILQPLGVAARKAALKLFALQHPTHLISGVQAIVQVYPDATSDHCMVRCECGASEKVSAHRIDEALSSAISQ